MWLLALCELLALMPSLWNQTHGWMLMCWIPNFDFILFLVCYKVMLKSYEYSILDTSSHFAPKWCQMIIPLSIFFFFFLWIVHILILSSIFVYLHYFFYCWFLRYLIGYGFIDQLFFLLLTYWRIFIFNWMSLLILKLL